MKRTTPTGQQKETETSGKKPTTTTAIRSMANKCACIVPFKCE